MPLQAAECGVPAWAGQQGLALGFGSQGAPASQHPHEMPSQVQLWLSLAWEVTAFLLCLHTHVRSGNEDSPLHTGMAGGLQDIRQDIFSQTNRYFGVSGM